jgi:mannitol/fructose-specific phosphotransferase system IIA component (Ntr-type)
MPVDEYLSPERTILLTTTDKVEALRELAGLIAGGLPGSDTDSVLKGIMERESIVSTKVAEGIAIPHMRLTDSSAASAALGISREGVPFVPGDPDPVHVILMIASAEELHLEVLSLFAKRLSSRKLYRALLAARTPGEAYRLITETGVPTKQKRPADLGANINILDAAFALAENLQAARVLVHADALTSPDILLGFTERLPLTILTRDSSLYDPYPPLRDRAVVVPFKGITRANENELSILFALSSEAVLQGERIVNVFGLPDSGHLDTITVNDVDKDFGLFFSLQARHRPADVTQQVLTRVIQLALEIASEGREGKPVGAIFILGDYAAVRKQSRQMVVNPFRGYSRAERSILDPSLEETIKEFSRIDGAFLIRGDGTIMAAGSYLFTERKSSPLTRGLGARHAAAASITASTKALAVAVSESTGQISIFSGGRRVMLL